MQGMGRYEPVAADLAVSTVDLLKDRMRSHMKPFVDAMLENFDDTIGDPRVVNLLSSVLDFRRMPLGAHVGGFGEDSLVLWGNKELAELAKLKFKHLDIEQLQNEAMRFRFSNSFFLFVPSQSGAKHSPLLSAFWSGKGRKSTPQR